MFSHRSLQLTERSPNRTSASTLKHQMIKQQHNQHQQQLQQHQPQKQQQKVVVRLGGASGDLSGTYPSSAVSQQPPIRNTSNFIPNNRLNNANIRHTRNEFALMSNNERHMSPTTTSTTTTVAADFRPSDIDKSKSFDVEYEKYHFNIKSEFDKSRSFDDDYGTQRPVKSVNDSRSFSNDRVYSKISSKSNKSHHQTSSGAKQQQHQQSPQQSYGSRLYEHEMMYDLARKAMDRSPIMEFRRQQQKQHRGGRSSRERSPSKASAAEQLMYRPFNRSVDQSLNHRRDLSPNDSLIKGNYYTTHSSPGSEFDANYDDIGGGSGGGSENNIMNAELIREAEIVTEFLYGNKAKAEAYLNQRRKDSKNITQTLAGNGGGGGGTPSTGRYIRN